MTSPRHEGTGRTASTALDGRQPQPPNRSKRDDGPLPLVSGAWLLRWFLAALAFAALCGYLTMCLLFYLGQWQLVFHPAQGITTTPATLGVPYDDVRFDSTETGVGQLDGWWIPADASIPFPDASRPTILFLHDGRGSLSDAAAQLKVLHGLGVNLFAIDYRGFGLSLNEHPSEQRVYQDADAAVAYLTGVRHVPGPLVVYGVGLGATVAAEAARRHREVIGLVLEDPAPPALTLIKRDPRTRLLPVRMVFRDRFELAPLLQGNHPASLFIQSVGAAHDENYFVRAAGEKMLFETKGPGPAYTDPAYTDAMRRFIRTLR